MFRRPLTSIELTNDDVDDMETAFKQKLAEKKECNTSSDPGDEDSVVSDETTPDSKVKTSSIQRQIDSEPMFNRGSFDRGGRSFNRGGRGSFTGRVRGRGFGGGNFRSDRYSNTYEQTEENEANGADFEGSSQYGYNINYSNGDDTRPNKRSEPSNDDNSRPDIEVLETKRAKTAQDYHKDAALKSWRLIVRNLPFKATRLDLQNICCKFGSFTDIVIPPSKKVEGMIAGYAFIQFKQQEAAEQAKEYFNTNKIKGRMVAADWALDKDTYETAAHGEREKLKSKVKVEEENKKSSISNRKVDDKEADEDDDMDEDEMTDVEMDDDSEESGEDDESEAESESEPEEKPKKESSTKKKDPKNRVAATPDNAVSEKRVVFLKNLSFDTTDAKLKTDMTKYGTVKLAISCKFRDSGHSKGTAFVHFSSSEEAAACIEAADQGDIQIDGRTINALLAIDRDSVVTIEKDKLAKAPKDSRNLRLLRFGLIRDGTAAAAGMSKDDSNKRRRLAEAARKKLENLVMFVSPTRLMIHNLPKKMDNDKLKALCHGMARPEANITECRIWLDGSRLDAEGKARSKGFAFVNFTEHRDALACLEKLNNHPTAFEKDKRPIVEFSIENLEALRSKERRNAGKISSKELSERVQKQVACSIGKVHAAGMKFLPKYTGAKKRHRDMSKRQLKVRGRKKIKTHADKLSADTGGSKPGGKNKKKVVSKYLSLTG